MTTLWHRVIVKSKSRLSPKVTGLTLELLNPSAGFTFLPGQWIDFRPSPSCSTANIEGKIGGYSMTSIPNQLPQLDLAVMTSRHPVAEWIVEKSTVNNAIDIRVGGNFTYEREQQHANRLLFIAGGVGINPLYSMMQQWFLDVAKRDDASRAVLLYSAATMHDFLFVNQLNKMVGAIPDRLSIVLTTTKRDNSISLAQDDAKFVTNNLMLKSGRIDRRMIRDAVDWLQRAKQDEHNTICGPPGMPESLKEILSDKNPISKGFVKSEADIYFEKWW